MKRIIITLAALALIGPVIQVQADDPLFVPAPPVAVGGEAFAVAVADANRDKRADLFVATGKSVTVLLGNGRTFAPAPGSPFRAGPGAYNVAVGDINEDGKPDLVASSFEGDSVTVLMGR